MRTLSFISISIFCLKIPSILTFESPRQILERNCPCFPSDRCLYPQLDKPLESKLPQCPSNQRRCCSKGDVLAAVSEVIKQNGLKADQIRLPSVECVPISDCEVTYGSLTSHFEEFGFINPLERNCMARDGMVLCIVDPNSPIPPGGPLTATRKPLPITEVEPVSDSEQARAPPLFVIASPNENPVRQTRLLPCVPLHVCDDVYDFGVEEHLNRYGPQQECYEFQSVRCVQLHASVLPKPSDDSFVFPQLSNESSSKEHNILPCVPDQVCKVVYEANKIHIAKFGYQDQCQHFDWVRCVEMELSIFPKPNDNPVNTNSDPNHSESSIDTDPNHFSSTTNTDQYQLHLHTNTQSKETFNANPEHFDLPTDTASNHFDSPTNTAPNHFDSPTNTASNHFDSPTNTASNHFDSPTNTASNHIDSPTNTASNHFDSPTNTASNHFDLPANSDPNHFDSSNIDLDNLFSPTDTVQNPIHSPSNAESAHFDSPTNTDPDHIPSTSNTPLEPPPIPTNSDNTHLLYNLFPNLNPVQLPCPSTKDCAHLNLHQGPQVAIFGSKPIYISNGASFVGPPIQAEPPGQDQPDEDQKEDITLLLSKIISQLDNLIETRNIV